MSSKLSRSQAQKMRCSGDDLDYFLTIPGRLPGLNEYISAERTNRYKTAKMKFAQDALVRAGVLEDDDYKHVVGFSDRFDVDKENPRIEVLIKEVDQCAT